MLDPQFLAQIRSYLNDNGNRALDAGIGSLIAPAAPAAAPAVAVAPAAEPKTDHLSSGIQSGINSVLGNIFKGPLPSGITQSAIASAIGHVFKPWHGAANATASDTKKNEDDASKHQEWMPIPIQALMPPSTYIPGRSGEFNYGIGNPQTATAIRAYNKMLAENAASSQNMATGGTVSTGNKVADARIAAGDQRVIRNQEAAATYAAMDNARNGTPIPAHLQQRLDARSSRNGPSGRSMEDGMTPAHSGLFGGLGSILSGHIAGYNGWGDMVNGGGKYGSRENPNPKPSGLRAMGDDLKRGGLGALLRDSFDGGGYGAYGNKFVGGPRSFALNFLGIKPIAFDQDFLGTDASNYEGSDVGGMRPRQRPVSFAEGGQIDPQSMGDVSPEGIGALRGQMEQPPEIGNEKDLISQTISAIKGEVAEPRPILGAFLAKYGEDALRDLVDKVHSGEVDDTAARSSGLLKGPGDGMDDRIPAKVEGGHDVLLANNEYVVPADVVSGLGNGSSDAGAKHLDEMMARVREQRTGSREQAKQINPKEVMPA